MFWLLSAASHRSFTAFQVKMNLTFMRHHSAVTSQFLCSRVQCGNATHRNCGVLNYKKLNFLFIWHGTQKKKQKFSKVRKRNIQLDVLSPKSNSKLIFRIFLIFSRFWTKSGKKRVFCDFLKNCEFWSKFDITNVFLVKFPFWKCILVCTFMNSLRSYVTK